MALPHSFLSIANFELAFDRVVRGANKEYKAFYRHLFPSYNLALRENLADLIKDVKAGYAPDKPTVVFLPKKSGILRPLTLLSLRDLIIYQALMNRIAVSFEKTQGHYALQRSFGALFAGKGSPFFYRSWKVCYAEYNKELTAAFRAGSVIVADFDLVSFYELIDHNLLRSCLSQKVQSDALLEFLFHCLHSWTSDVAGDHVHHGVPQGPEPSAFLAECLLFRFDALRFRRVRYFRYIDDIKLMGDDEVFLRRALLRLDLCSKELGLVPQAQKIECRRVRTVGDVLRTIPSALASAAAGGVGKPASQRRLRIALDASMQKIGRKWAVKDDTRFKYALNRLRASKRVLKRIGRLLVSRPDLSWVLGSYLKKFPTDKVAADTLLEALRRDPTYDAAAANYIDAMDACEPTQQFSAYRRVIQTANRRSEEKSILLPMASLTFRGPANDAHQGSSANRAARQPSPKGNSHTPTLRRFPGSAV